MSCKAENSMQLLKPMLASLEFILSVWLSLMKQSIIYFLDQTQPNTL